MYRGTNNPRLAGTYFYGDYCSGRLRGATRSSGTWTSRVFSARAAGLTTFGEDAAGELYLATENGFFAKIADANPAAPTVAGVSPVSGSARGGDLVILTGTNFSSAATVTFGGVPATTIAVLDPIATRLSVVTPAHAVGAVDVVVTNPDARSSTLSSAYSFAPVPRVTPPPRTTRTIRRP